MTQQPWAVYMQGRRHVVRRWNGNTRIVAIFIDHKSAREYADRENKTQKEERRVERGEVRHAGAA